MSVDNSFEDLLGRVPTDEERQKLYKVQKSLKIRDNDALWSVLIALENYNTLYKAIPKEIEEVSSRAISKIETASLRTLAEVKTTADAVMEASAEATKRELAEAVTKASSEVAYNTSRKQMWKWALGCLIGTALILGCIFWYAHSSGRDAGYAQGLGEGYAKAQDEKAAAAWANTPEGKLAYRLAQAGNIRQLTMCDGLGWKIEDGWCYVHVDKDNMIHGWRIPPQK